MKKTNIVKLIIWFIIGILCYLLMEFIIGDNVTALIKTEEKGNDRLFPFYWLMLIVGLIIVSTLSYVSWRKYKGEKDEKKNHDNDVTID
ncbi:sporulation protein YpjB [Ornithinibacillus scapharcae]|uniref:sporulation protein YpjB n=1 Tax=Ornithinibacillus scapharcae TaxID=1147159 RepID=UPI000225BA29|nr:sporulation protein YpjB [Ornithinibacillus scapharcae]